MRTALVCGAGGFIGGTLWQGSEGFNKLTAGKLSRTLKAGLVKKLKLEDY